MTFAQAEEVARRGRVVARTWMGLLSKEDGAAMVQDNCPDFFPEELWREVVAWHLCNAKDNPTAAEVALMAGKLKIEEHL